MFSLFLNLINEEFHSFKYGEITSLLAMSLKILFSKGRPFYSEQCSFRIYKYRVFVSISNCLIYKLICQAVKMTETTVITFYSKV